MAIEIDTPFRAFDFTEEEEEQAYVFTTLQKQHIRSELARAATEKVKLKMTGDLNEVAKQHAYLEGKIEMCELLLAMSEDVTSEAQQREEKRVTAGLSRPWFEAVRAREDAALQEQFATQDAPIHQRPTNIPEN